MMKAGHFKWLSATVAVMVMVMAAGAFAQEKPEIAVYVKGGISDEVKTAFRNELLFALVKSERYYAVDDNDAFVAAVKRETERHGVSEMNDMQIARTGENVDADFVCVANVSPVLGGYQVFARVIDVKNEAVAEMGRGAGAIANVADIAKIAGEVVESMFGVSGKAAPQVQAAVPAQQIMPEQQTPVAETPTVRPRGPIKAAVYVTGVPDLVGKTLNSAISSALIKSKVYAGIESIDVSGATGVPALADAGRNAGVSYIFAINVAGQISVAIIDVAGSMELAKISIDGKITAINAAAIAKKIVDFILTSGPKPDPDAQIADGAAPVQSEGDGSDGKPRILQSRISIEFAMGGMYGSYRYSYGDTVSPERAVPGSSSVGGLSGYTCLDFKYFEIFENMAGPADGFMLGLLAKYPFVFDQVPVKVSPILGFGGIRINGIDNDYDNNHTSSGLILGGRIDVGISKITYVRSEYLYNLGVVRYKGSSGMSLKTGGGLDIGLGKKKKAFWHTELMYNQLSAYNPKYNNPKYKHSVDVRKQIHYVDIKTGIGYKWGGGSDKQVPVEKVPVEIRAIEIPGAVVPTGRQKGSGRNS